LLKWRQHCPRLGRVDAKPLKISSPKTSQALVTISFSLNFCTFVLDIGHSVTK